MVLSKNMNIIIKQNYLNSLYQTLNKNFSFNFNIKSLSKFKKFKTVAIIGMGGSILGAEAIYSFLQSSHSPLFLPHPLSRSSEILYQKVLID